MMRHFEQCAAWAVQIGQGSGETADATIERARKIFSLMGDWAAEINGPELTRADFMEMIYSEKSLGVSRDGQ